MYIPIPQIDRNGKRSASELIKKKVQVFFDRGFLEVPKSMFAVGRSNTKCYGAYL